MNTCILIAVRYHSTRLPGKALLEIGGQTVTDILIDRLKHTGLPIVLCTGDNPDNEKYLKPIAERKGISFFVGSEENIIKRHYDCSKAFNLDVLINVNGDDILCCPEIVNAVAYEFKQQPNAEYICAKGLPFGLEVDGYTPKRLENIKFAGDTGFGEKILNAGIYSTIKFNYDYDFRLSLDYKEDFVVIKHLIKYCKKNITVEDICLYLKKHPKIASYNLFRNKEYWERFNKLKEKSIDA